MKKDEGQHLKEKDQIIEQLETLAFHFTQLSKRLSQDREHWAETGKDLTKAVEKLNHQIQQFADLEKRFKEQIATVMQRESQEAARTIAKAFGETTHQILAEQIKATADHLNRVVHQAGDTLANYQGELKSLRKWFLIGIILSALVGNILAGVAVYYFLPLMEIGNSAQSLEAIRAIEEREGKHNPLSHQPRGQTKLLE